MKILCTIASIAFFANITAQECSEEKSAAYHAHLNKEFANPEESPLTKSDLATFISLEFYPVDLRFCVQARFVRTPKEKPFLMKTTTSRSPRYVKYGEAYFTLDGKEYKLDIFQSLDLIKIAKYKDDLFLPFTDYTSGNGSYGGGRYVDLKKPDGENMVIDFNTAYNPYCAYNHDYSCPIPPKQNDLAIEIKAGVKDYKH